MLSQVLCTRKWFATLYKPAYIVIVVCVIPLLRVPSSAVEGGRVQLSKQTIWQWWAAVAIPWYTLVVTGSNTVVRDHFQPVHSHIFSITGSTCEGVRGEV